MTKKTFKVRFEEFIKKLKDVGTVVEETREVEWSDTPIVENVKVVINRKDLEKLMEDVSDFVEVREFEEELKQYRFGSHIISYRKGNNSMGSIEIDIVEDGKEVVEEKEVHVAIYDKVAKTNIDWYDIKESEIEKDLKDIEAQKDYYKDCIVRVNGEVMLEF